jgi:hypothetical protein
LAKPENLEHHVRLLLMDAVSEFQTGRIKGAENTPDAARAYVDRRYDWMNEEEREKKAHQVRVRIQLARLMHRGIGTTLEVTQDATVLCPQCNKSDQVYSGPDSYRCRRCDTSFIP